MKHADNALRTQALLLAMKALDVISKTLDIIAADDAAPAAPAPSAVPSADAAPAAPAPSAAPSADAAPAAAGVVGGFSADTESSAATPSSPCSPKPPKPSKPSSPDTYRADAIRFNEQFLRDHYDLRYNTMKKTTEFRPRQSESAAAPHSSRGGVRGGVSPLPPGEASVEEAPWQPITERDLNALTVGQLLAGGQSWSYGMKLCIDSSRVDSFDPVNDYLGHLPRWDGHDHIAELAARVPTQYEGWPMLFRRWLLAMVAQARGMSQDHGNSLVPMLIGAQGTGKSTFCKMLLPRQLRQYYMDDIKMDNAEQVERVLGRMWLVNIDEYDSKTQREQSKIKRLLTERDVQVRRPRSDQYTLVRRVCSFIATTNDRRPLCDPTGSRRYLCVELTGAIDTATPIDHGQLFAQALHALAQGEPFFLTREEEAQMEAHNRRYCRQTVLLDAVQAVLQPAPTSADTLMTTTDIEELLAAGGLRPQDMPSPRQLTAALRAAGLRRGAQQGRHGWYAKAVEAENKKSAP